MLCTVCNASNQDSAGSCRACGAPLSAAAPAAALHALPVGTKLQCGAFAVGKVLGQGGFGITYLGADARSRRSVAIKELFLQGCARQRTAVHPPAALAAPDYQGAKGRFLGEARILAQFRHRGIVQVHTAFEENNTAYMVMELLKGCTLLRLLEQHGPLAEPDALSTITPVAEALAVVHQAQLLHRDIKPENVIRTEDGRVVLLDFGTAREFAAGKTKRMTAMLTPGYAPLEQYGQQARFGAFTDVYALGAMLYHLLTGQVPVQATDRAAGVTLAPPHRVKSSVSRATSDAVMWAMEMKVDRRPQSMLDFLGALRGTPPPTATAARSRARSAAPPPAPVPNPFEPRIQQILAEVAKAGLKPAPTPVPPSRYDARVQQINASLAALARSAPANSFQCPACHKGTLAHLTGHPDGRCPLCRGERLSSRPLDLNRCAVCRRGKLVEQRLSGEQMFCPVCRVMPLQKQRHIQCGSTLDVGCACPHCKAEFDLLPGGKARLARLDQDPYGMRRSVGKTLSIAEWKRLTGRSDRYWVCGGCAARFDAPDEKRLTLVHLNEDPHGVGKTYRGKTFFRTVWAKAAQGLPPTSGNRFCARCQAEFDYDEVGQTLHLLQCDAQAHRWARGWRGKTVPLQTWYLAAAGKRSLRPGWTCSACKTEFDNDQASFKLVWTPAGPLSPLTGKSLALADWHRRAAGLPSTTEEKRLRDDLARLQALKQQEQSRLQHSQQRRHAPLERELAQLCRQSLLGGHIRIPLKAPHIALRAHETIRWQSAGCKWRLRSSQGTPYWDREAQGTLVVTSERLLFDPAQGNLWQHSLKKLRSAASQHLQDTSGLALQFEDLQKPVGFSTDDMTVDLKPGGTPYAVTLTLDDLAQMLKASP